MFTLKTLTLSALVFFLYDLCYAQSPENDWRNIKFGNSILASGYCDQPYVVIYPDRDWLVVFTTNEGHEGSKGQHIVSSVSKDQGKTWSKPVQIEMPSLESASWAMPYLTDYGRVYAFHTYNGDKIHELDGKNIREDIIGWYCYKYSDDKGKTWSKRYRLDVPVAAVDRMNDWGGDVQILWGIGKPVDVDQGMMFAFTRVGRFMLDYSEGWYFRCDNINIERNIEKLAWKLYPESGHGVKNEKLGLINAEHNIFQMNDGKIYSMHRTIAGHPAEAYSSDGGKSWTLPEVPEYENGISLKNPRACPRIWKAQNGKYLFWYHHNGGWNFDTRNPAWISGGIEKNGEIVWSQPEILFYDDDPATRMSYPDLIEQDGKYWITETNKSNARCHEIPAEFMNMLWEQFEINKPVTKGLIAEWNRETIKTGIKMNANSNTDNNSFSVGFTLDFTIELGDLTEGQLIYSANDAAGRSVILKTGDFGSIEIELNDGKITNKWNSDPGLITTYAEHCVTVSVDCRAMIIQFVVDEIVCNGRDFRKFGWGRFEAGMANFSFKEGSFGKLPEGQFRPEGKVTSFRIYDRPLLNTEIIGNHRHYRKL